MQQYSALERNDVLIRAAAWVGLENFMLSETKVTLSDIEGQIVYNSTYRRYLE